MNKALINTRKSQVDGVRYPRVSIVTPSFNQGQFIERTILSVLKQDYPNLQYIVADALSNDRTSAILDKYRQEIDIIVQEKDDGQADALDKSFKLADGQYMAYLNSDDCLASPSVVSDVVRRFQAEPQIDLFYGKRYYIDENGFVIIAHPFREFNKELLYKACYLPQECAFWTRAIYDKAGGSVNKEFRFAMDYDLWLRFLENGARFAAIDKLYGLFRWYPNQKSHAVWETVGLPEIARLQEKYTGRSHTQTRMNTTFDEHFSGVNKIANPRTADIYEKMWHLQTHLKRVVLGLAPMDHWVFVKELKEGGEIRAS